jgi:hypothetical protein
MKTVSTNFCKCGSVYLFCFRTCAASLNSIKTVLVINVGPDYTKSHFLLCVAQFPFHIFIKFTTLKAIVVKILIILVANRAINNTSL